MTIQQFVFDLKEQKRINNYLFESIYHNSPLKKNFQCINCLEKKTKPFFISHLALHQA